ncbi:DUF2634 domain-containing protein [Paenibacillus sp. RC84]|uniref:DUF2634 domain-containing protein n=1 Tax=Paenibacillus sp. RC84 TaxID=3156252 RepID=UPI003514BD0A
MLSLKLQDGDLVFENGELVMIEGPEELRQCVEINLSTNKGEWFLNPNAGIRFSRFLGKNPSEEAMRDEIRKGLLQDTRIKTVDDISFEYDRPNRMMNITFRATATDGEEIRGEVPVNVG